MSGRETIPSARGAWSLADDAVLAAVKAQILGSVDDAPRLGRYEIERPLGAGAMGRILLARDGQLDRLVALKLITPALAHDPIARARIVREARAMAKLSDSHVAQVYEVGEDGDQLFVAMEYVDGQGLRSWLEQEPRPWRRVVEVFVQAGRGLAAAHAKGLAHRDFKPDNVVLPRDGAAKVVDFGLARDFGESGGAARTRGTSTPSLPAMLTATGAWLGTPAYMAPEQWEGGRVDARSDQFSFCVALYEALAGRRPFEGETATEVRAELARGRIPTLGGGTRIPRRVDAAIRRGLAVEPEDRWPSMEALLRALTPRSPMRRLALPAAAGLTLAAALLTMGDDDRCVAAGAPMDALWDDEARRGTAAAMEALEVPWAEATGEVVRSHLDEAADAWRGAAQAVCAAEEPPPGSEACLEHARSRIAEAIERAGSSDPAMVVGAAADAELLVDARVCLQPSALGWLRALPQGWSEEGSVVARVARWEAERRLGELSTAAGAERYVASLARGREAAREAREGAERAGDRPLVAASAWVRGRLALRDGDRDTAEGSLREAMDVALEVGDTGLRAAAAVDLLFVVGRDRDRSAEAATLARDAEAILASLGERPLWTAKLAAHRASVLAHAEPPDPEAAAELHAEAVVILRRVLGDEHPDVIVALGNLGAALGQAGRVTEAREHLGEAIDRARRLWGEGHPRTAQLEGTLGQTLATEGDLVGAREHLERSLRGRVAALGEDHDAVASARYNLAMVMRRQGDHADAIEQLEAGLRSRERSRGPDDPGNAEWLQRIGISELARGRPVRARESLHRALRLCERFGASPDRFANIRVALARAYADEDPAKARVLAELARREWIDDPHERPLVDALIAELVEAEAARAGAATTTTTPPRPDRED